VPRPVVILLVSSAIAIGLGYVTPAKSAGWLACGVAVAGSVPACTVAHPLCPAGWAVAACACVPRLVPEFEGMACPGFRRVRE
jgi:hypothetical protein